MEQRLADFRAARKRAGLTANLHLKQSSLLGEKRSIPAAKLPSLSFACLCYSPNNKVNSVYCEFEAAQPGGSTSQPPQNIAIPLPPRHDRSFLINITVLKVLLWLVLLGLFVELEFGLAYFILSLFYWMYVGTRSPEEKKAGEKSAYSVFNPGCEAIQGTLTAEQLERELQLRPLEG
uniref:SAYSVFN motif domain containing 1 n=1 Tax=Loxodonta africana TaxID=9785 RepID=G3SU25_LOXAF